MHGYETLCVRIRTQKETVIGDRANMNFFRKYSCNILKWEHLYYFVTIVILLLFVQPCYSQRFYRPEIRETLSTGFYVKTHLLQQKDDAFSPLRYNGPSGELNLITIKYPGNFRRSLELGMQAGYIENRFKLSGWHVNPRLSFSYSVKVDGLSGRDSWVYAGPAISGNTSITFFSDEDPHHIYWFTCYSLDLFFVAGFEVDRSRMLFLEAGIPLAAVVSRPGPQNSSSYHIMEMGEILRRVHSNARFTTVDEFQSANLKLMVDLTRTNRGSVTLGYEMLFLRYSGEVPATYFNNGAFLRVMFDSHIR